jgi:hypothetical protein
MYASFKAAVQISQLKYVAAILAAYVYMARKTDLCFSEGPGFIGAQYIHGAKVLDRRWLINDPPLLANSTAPLAKVTVTTISKSSGVSPTASASENRKDSNQLRQYFQDYLSVLPRSQFSPNGR